MELINQDISDVNCVTLANIIFWRLNKPASSNCLMLSTNKIEVFLMLTIKTIKDCLVIKNHISCSQNLCTPRFGLKKPDNPLDLRLLIILKSRWACGNELNRGGLVEVLGKQALSNVLDTCFND